MKTYKKYVHLFLAITLALALLAGCSDASGPEERFDEVAFTYSDGINDKGFWTGVKAVDHIEMFTYSGMEIPSDIHSVSDEEVQDEIDYILEYYITTEEVTDRAVIEGDTVNIDYVGSVDGIKFDGGSTKGERTEVTAGGTNYIDDFLTQIIGHLPGETFDVEVTFPDDYEEESLQGRDAVFVTTINFIAETFIPELTDEFIETTLYDSYGWTTVEEMTDGLRNDLLQYALEDYILDYLYHDVTILSVPDAVMEYNVKAMQDYYQGTADSYGMEFSEFLADYLGVADMDELIADNEEGNMNNARYSLASQAVAEEAGLSVSDEDVVEFFTRYMGTSDYSSYEEAYGLPYLKQLVLQRKVLEFIIEHANLL